MEEDLRSTDVMSAMKHLTELLDPLDEDSDDSIIDFDQGFIETYVKQIAKEVAQTEQQTKNAPRTLDRDIANNYVRCTNHVRAPSPQKGLSRNISAAEFHRTFLNRQSSHQLKQQTRVLKRQESFKEQEEQNMTFKPTINTESKKMLMGRKNFHENSDNHVRKSPSYKNDCESPEKPQTDLSPQRSSRSGNKLVKDCYQWNEERSRALKEKKQEQENEELKKFRSNPKINTKSQKLVKNYKGFSKRWKEYLANQPLKRMVSEQEYTPSFKPNLRKSKYDNKPRENVYRRLYSPLKNRIDLELDFEELVEEIHKEFPQVDKRKSRTPKPKLQQSGSTLEFVRSQFGHLYEDED